MLAVNTLTAADLPRAPRAARCPDPLTLNQRIRERRALDPWLSEKQPIKTQAQNLNITPVDSSQLVCRLGRPSGSQLAHELGMTDMLG